MARVRVKSYTSPSLVLLALDWPDGKDRDDFLGFAIKRAPGFDGAAESWLPNRIGFDGPAQGDVDFPSDEAPIQRFQWWDARIDEADRGTTFKYTVSPVVGEPGDLKLLKSASATRPVTLPLEVEQGIGTWFNRAVVSSQAFTKKFARDGKPLSGQRFRDALAWLANGIQDVVPEFLASAQPIEGAIYHLTDKQWVIPALDGRAAPTSLVFDATKEGTEANDEALTKLGAKVEFLPRKRANIMHDKFLVRLKNGQPDALLMGSANFTTGAFSTQANVVHTFESPELAGLYLKRKELLKRDLTLGKTAAEGSGWSEPVAVGDARIRVFFPPESTATRESIDTIVHAVEHATSSVVFCIFTPTDAALRNAVFAAGDKGRMMFGLINEITKPKPDAKPGTVQEAKVATFNRSRESKDVFAHNLFPKSVRKKGFWFEVAGIPGAERAEFPVFIHHKFVVIDAETDHPTIYTGSANMSEGSLHNNDENMLEIKGSVPLAHAYLAEFMRLYEHYRARAHEDDDKPPGASQPGAVPCRESFALAKTACWAEDDFKPGTPRFKSRTAMTD